MKGLTTTLLVLCAVICTYAQFDRNYRNGASWPPTVSGSSEEISSDEKHPTSLEASSKGDLGVPESFEAEDREFTYYPVAEKVNGIGNVFYEVIDEIRTERGDKKKSKSKKGKCKKKSKKKKGKKKSKSKGCGAHGGWWYVWDKKHGYISGRWGDPPPKGLEKEHYDHNYGHGGHDFGGGYDGHGKMKKKGGHQGGGGGGGGAQGWGWKKQIKGEHYPHGWAEKQKEHKKGWGW